MNAILSLVVCASSLICAPFSPRQIDLDPCSSIDEAVDDSKKADGDFIFIDQSQSKNKLSTYFSNLYKYSPKNSCGSCGIVSLSQCLAYYDTVLNDDIIPEQYDDCSTHMRNYETILSYLQADTSFNFPIILFSYIHETEYYNIQDEDMQELMKSYIKENSEEEHSNNYLVNNNEFCGCSAINHSHIYLSGFLPISSKNHLAFCSCGESIVTEHKFSNRLGSSNYCSRCKLFIDMEDSANE